MLGLPFCPSPHPLGRSCPTSRLVTVPVCSQSLMASCFPGLAIDYPESKLYWISSGNGTINRCNLDGSNLEVIESVRGQLSKATALAIMGESWQGDRDGSWSPFLSPDPPQTLATSSSCGGGMLLHQRPGSDPLLPGRRV